MSDTIVVTIAYDHAAKVWYTADCPALPGLIYEADTVEEMLNRLPRLAKALLEDRADVQSRDIPIELRLRTMAHVEARA